MKFQLYSSKNGHKGFASCVCWLNNELVVTCADDRKLLFWNSATHHEPTRSIQLPIDAYPTSMHFLASPGGVSSSGVEAAFANYKSEQQSNFLIALGASNGRCYLLPTTWNGTKIDKSFEAHNGAVITIKWSNDNSTLATGGEDGVVKIWSRAGMLRSTLCSCSVPIYSLAWSADSNSLIYVNNTHLVLKSLLPQSRAIEWQAHEGLIVSLNWAIVNNLILSASEDGHVKMWDHTGRLIFVSAIHTSGPSSVVWSPDGQLFALSTFNTLKLHDSSGMCLAIEKLSLEGIHEINWSPDSNQLCAVCANGQVIFAYVIERTVGADSVWQIINSSRRTINVTNCSNDLKEVLEFRDSIIRMSFAYEHLVVVTSTQCFIYQTNSWTTPHHFDTVGAEVYFIKQSEKHFLLLTSVSNNLYAYDGRFLRSLKLTNVRLNHIRPNTISLSNTAIAFIDGLNLNTIHFVHLESGKSQSANSRQTSSYKHQLEVYIVRLAPKSRSNEVISVILDKNSDFYIVSLSGISWTTLQAYKLSSMICDFIWHTEWNMLISINEKQSISMWLYPSAAYVDSALLQDVVLHLVNDEANTKNSSIVGFSQNQLTVQTANQVKVYIPVNPFVMLLHKMRSTKRWKEAVKMCNFLDKSMHEFDSIDRVLCNALWATLAVMSLEEKQFITSGIAYAAINKMDKVLYLNKVQKLSNREATSAELELMCGNITAAEQYFLHKGFILRAVVLNLELYKWKRALQIAEQYNDKFDGLTVDNHNSTNDNKSEEFEAEAQQSSKKVSLTQLVLVCRQHYLRSKNKTENIKEYQELFNKTDDQLFEWPVMEKLLKSNESMLYRQIP